MRNQQTRAGTDERATPRGAPEAAGRRSEADRDLASRMLAAAGEGKDVRARKVRRLRAAIKVRAYENELKLAVAFERLRADAEALLNDPFVRTGRAKGRKASEGRRGAGRAGNDE